MTTNEEQTLADIESLIQMWRSKLISPLQAVVDILAMIEIYKVQAVVDISAMIEIYKEIAKAKSGDLKL